MILAFTTSPAMSGSGLAIGITHNIILSDPQKILLVWTCQLVSIQTSPTFLKEVFEAALSSAPMITAADFESVPECPQTRHLRQITRGFAVLATHQQ
jgi:hypothetical protein